MHAAYSIWFCLVESTRLAADATLKDAALPEWTDDDPAASDAMAERNAGIVTRLQSRLPGLAPVPDRIEDICETIAGGLSPETMIRRFHRMRVVAGPWPMGTVHVWLYDGIAHVLLTITAPADPPRLEQAVASLTAAVAEATSCRPILPDGRAAAGSEIFAAALLAHHTAGLRRARRRYRWHRILRALGMPGLLILGAAALLTTGAILWDAYERSRRLHGADPARPMTFITTAIPPPTHLLGLLPRFALDAVIAETGQPVRLPVYRDQAMRGGPRAMFTVLPTGDSETPFILKTVHDRSGPVLPLAGRGIAWTAILALIPPALFGWLVARPWLTAPAGQRDRVRQDTGRKLVSSLLLTAIAVLALLARLPL